MPQLEYALICDYVRPQEGLVHIMGGNVDTVFAPEVPAVHNMGFAALVRFGQDECGSEHRVAVKLTGPDGDALAQLDGIVTPTWQDELPADWTVGATFALNFGVVLPAYGVYRFDVSVDDISVKSLPLRVVEPQGQAV